MNEDPLTFLDLNDDCLLAILQYISVPELFSLLGHFGERFDNIVYERIAQLKQLIINLRDPPTYTTWQLKVIGKHLKSLYISAGYALTSDLTLKYLQPICSQGSLQALTLHYIQFDCDYHNCILKVAPKLHILDLSFCQLTDNFLAPILENCTNLRTLAVFGNNNLKCESLSCVKSNYLKELKVEQNDNCKNAIQLFVAKNPQVTVTVFALGHLGHLASKSYDDMMMITPKSLGDLNDDCLLEILQYLNLRDTFSIIGHFGPRINDVAYGKIAQLKHLRISQSQIFENWQLEIIGKNLIGLEIYGLSLFPPQTLKLLQTICHCGILQTLILNFIQFDNDYKECLLKVAATLQHLDLEYCQLTDDLLSPILKCCKNLKTLDVAENPKLFNKSLKCLKSKYLEKLTVGQYSWQTINIGNKTLETFIAQNPWVTVTVYAQLSLGAWRFGHDPPLYKRMEFSQKVYKNGKLQSEIYKRLNVPIDY